MTTTSSFRSTVAAVGIVVACSLLDLCAAHGDLRICYAIFAASSLQAFAQHPVEGRERVDDVGERVQRRAQLDREHEFAQDLAGTRRDQRRADQHAALAVGDQLERAAVKVMDVAARGLGRIGGGDDDVDAFRARRSLRQPDRSDFGIGECHARDRGVIGPRVHAPQSARDHLPVVVGEVSEPAESRDVTGAEDAGLRFERRRIHLQPPALRLCEPGRAPRLRVGAAARGHQQPVGAYRGSGLQVDDDGGALARGSHEWLFDGDTGVSDHQHHAVRLQMWPERDSRLWFLEAKKPRSGFDHGDPATETRERLPQLDANGAAAEDRQRHRQLPRDRRLAVGPELDGVQARDGRDRRGAAVGDDHRAPRDELLASNRDRAQVRQCPFTAKEPGAGRLHRGGRPAVVEVACHPQHACGDFGKVDGPFHARGGEDDARDRPRSTFRLSEARSWKARSPSTGTRRPRALARQPRASARCPGGRRRSLLRRRHRRDTRRQTPVTIPNLPTPVATPRRPAIMSASSATTMIDVDQER